MKIESLTNPLPENKYVSIYGDDELWEEHLKRMQAGGSDAERVRFYAYLNVVIERLELKEKNLKDRSEELSEEDQALLRKLRSRRRS